ncbi:dihydrolipoyllysine-residue acetyltransferase [Alteromonas sp. W364]|jgi:pyruvate dehydrogenase E2 component (dihydrolipoamide acetyltransferase)|uniref:dihydrolipoyllysine-residue acetyltransferase n=1 Tax=Alteromonas sp. W364 TaxID=3075610 RepID=UPI0028857843|nr:dihydrolipoyllysine-residue acetyltransferase [Alteromonas sp. W364]MDT0627589.1 dihydrolipoyllysine-residue acetyltransferase [Alteromonas sp. W364]
MANLIDIVVPDVGDDEVEVIEICVSEGEEVEAEASIVTVESDKASMDIPCTDAGTIKSLSVKVGDKIKQGDVLGQLESGADASESSSDDAAVEPKEEPKAEAAPEKKAEPAKSSTSTGGSKTIEVTVPDIGDATDVEIIELLVAEGDSVEPEDGLITLETDKATMDVPAPEAGKIVSLAVNVGDKVSEGSLVLTLEVAGGEESEASAPSESRSEPESSSSQSNEASGESKTIEVMVPDIGDATDVDIIEVLVAEGDTVEPEDGLITLETDKATMDVPAPEGGKVLSLAVKVGDKVSEGSLVLTLEVAGSSESPTPKAESAPKAPAKSEAPAASRPVADTPKAPPVPHHPSAGDKGKTGKIHASPSVRRLAREFGVDLSQVKGSGRKNRIQKEDVQSYVKYELSRPKMNPGSSAGTGTGGGLQVLAQPKVDFAKFGEVEEVPLTRIQKLSGPNLHRNWVTIPHVTQFDEADITELEEFRKEQNAIAEKRKLGVKITPLVFMMKAVADALKAYPAFNSSLSSSGESLVMKKYYHIGIAVDTPNGLVVPVVRDVDKKGIMDISKELMDISVKARDGKLKSADMQGSCFTISSLGGIGGTAFTPIVNAPDVAILGVSKSEIKPKWNGKDFEPRLMLPLSLSYDHRVIDGALAARFAVHVSGALSDLRRILL